MINDEPSFRLDFVGIGAARCGTTWLTQCLRTHPQICVSSQKEIRYFNAINHLRNIPNKNHTKPFSWYVDHFQHWQTGQIRGEFSPPYLCDPVAPALIRRRFPDVKILVSLRNPIDRAYSGHLMRMFHGAESRSFDEAIEQHSGSIENGFYARQLGRYLDLFKRDQLLIMLYEDLVANPAEGLKTIFAFLDVDPRVTVPADTIQERVNATRLRQPGEKKSRGLLAEIMKAIRPPAPPAPVPDKLQYPPLNSQVREKLLAIYRDDIRALETMLDRDLSHWR